MEVSWGWRQPLEPVKEHRPWSKGDLSSNPGFAPTSLCDLRHNNTALSEPQFAHLRNEGGSHGTAWGNGENPEHVGQVKG